MNIYSEAPIAENEDYKLRLVSISDCDDLFKPIVTKMHYHFSIEIIVMETIFTMIQRRKCWVH